MTDLLIVGVLVLFNAFFAMSEMAVLTSRKTRLMQQAQTSRGARKALELANHPEGFLSAVQLWISLLSLMIGYFGGESLGAKLAGPVAQVPALAPYADRIGFISGFLVMLFVFGLIGELVPKRIGTMQPERIAGLVAYPMDFFAKAAKPFVILLSACTRLVLRVLRLSSGNSQAITEEEIHMLVSEGHEQGVIDLDERNMMTRVMRLGEETAASLMTPRTRISWLDAAAGFDENLANMRETPFSRYPVYRGNDSEVLGILEVKHLLDQLELQQPDLFRHLREALFVSESTHALKLLEIMREEQQSLAMVVDEYGDIQGLVTISDVMGSVLGRLLAGEGADADPLVVTREDGSLLVDGSLRIGEFREITGERLPNAEEHDYYTAAGMVIAHFGRIPHVGEYFALGAWRVEVVDLDGPRVDKLLLQRMPDQTANDDDG
ncbi:MAG: hemolysin family protein [Thermomonas sp.]